MKASKIIAEVYALAREFCALNGCTVHEGCRINHAIHPQERLTCRLAACPFESLRLTDLDYALADADEEQ